jgi:release factor glutamine methyltransferase
LANLTIKEALKLASNSLLDSDSGELDSEVLLAHVVKKNRSYFRAWPDRTLSADDLHTFLQLIEQRQSGQPIAYLTGEREFWSRSFIVSPDVLIPRPDTELLIDIVQQEFTTDQSFSILDLGTGSGAIAITLALEFSNASVTAVDSSIKALAIANKNSRQLNANKVEFIHSVWFEQVPSKAFDIIISNPPYICQTDPHLLDGDVRFEPNSALVAMDGGLLDIKHITSNAHKYLKSDGVLLFEHGYQQGVQVKNLLESSGFKSTEQFQDIQGHTRATLGKKP